MKFLSKLLADLDQQPLRPPLLQIPENAEVIGELPDDLKRLMSRNVDAKRRAEHLAIDVGFAENEEQRKEMERELYEAQTEHNLLDLVLSYEVRTKYGLFSEHHVVIAEGWQVVVMTEQLSIESVFGQGSGRGLSGLFDDLFRSRRHSYEESPAEDEAEGAAEGSVAPGPDQVEGSEEVAHGS